MKGESTGRQSALATLGVIVSLNEVRRQEELKKLKSDR